jgi:oxygen-independent coproporphyrinogen-3 oxidase
MLLSVTPDVEAVRFAAPESLEQYVNGAGLQRTPVSHPAALEESFFLGLRLTRGIRLKELAATFGEDAVQNAHASITELVECGLIEQHGDSIRLTSRGRLLSNEVFERFILDDEVVR